MKSQGQARALDATSTSRPIPIRERQRQQTRDIILEVALAEIAERGLSGVRIERIARLSGVTRPTVYAHFPTREDFLRELQARTEGSALAALQQRLESNRGTSLVHALADALFDILSETKLNLRRESFALMLREPHSERWMSNDLFVYLSTRLAEAQKTGEIPDHHDASELTRLVMTALFGFIVIEGSDEPARRADAHNMLDLLIGNTRESRP